jgi:hypothetical protein
MDKEVLRYLADLSAVRSYANQIMAVSRSNINQKDLHSISAKTTQLDKLFCDVLIGRAKIPGSQGAVVNTSEDDDDIKTISQRLAEEKNKLTVKKNKPTEVKTLLSSEDSEDDFINEDYEETEEEEKKEVLLVRPKIKTNKK